MSFALQPTSLIPVRVTTDWTNADNAAADIITALEASFPGVFQFPLGAALVITGVQLQGAASGKGTISIAAVTNAGTWTAGFGTYPAVGSIAYIIDMY